MDRQDFHQLDTISVSNLEVRCLVGLYPRELIQPQPLLVNIKLYLDTRKAAKTACLDYSVDYASLAEEIAFVLQNSRFKLLETAAEAISQHLLSSQFFDKPQACVEGVDVQIDKPKALPGTCIPSLKITRVKSEFVSIPLAPGSKEFIIHRNNESLLLKIKIPAGEKLSLGKPPKVDITDLILSRNLMIQGTPIAPLSLWQRSAGPWVSYTNSGKQDAYILSVVRGSPTDYMAHSFSNSNPIPSNVFPMNGKLTEKQGIEH